MSLSEPITLTRGCEVIEIPFGTAATLPSGARVRVTQSLGGGYTIAADDGRMYRVDAKDVDSLGLVLPSLETEAQPDSFREEMVTGELKTVYDPEIPVSVVDLGLIYSAQISEVEAGGKRIEIKMSMTAPGCGMGNVLKADVERKLLRLPEVKEVDVEIVFDPPWSPARMSDAAKLQLGFDMDYGSSSEPSAFRVIR